MSLSATISPYPGLRPFTESETVFFKGREKHIAKIQHELLAHRFLMVTGASGDGKSSLIFAGLLPNIRAGFVRGEYARWQVAIFRPGNQPMSNMCNAVSKALKIDKKKLAEQLKFGYSALIDQYKDSGAYLNENDETYKALEADQQKKAKRKAANLLIVIDQFEEFFTTDENFDKETALPSAEAQLVMNLIIETARVSQVSKLPIYIVCTMRSDYIGNAPAYRRLPELLGDHQFFVPRLNRDEIQHVIEEPILLNNNKITKRLTQRLINDLDYLTTDLLPCLQHALRRIWEIANEGEEPLDLLHYAMAGGMAADELQEQDRKQFNTWKAQLPLYHQELFKSKSSVTNVLNLHANLLYLTAHEQERIEISTAETRRILMHTFKCLTQIDDSRVVRNRMTIADILQLVKTDHETLIAVISVFRQQGNTFIFPFLNNNNEPSLERDTLLDITHEALIRNWELLKEWTIEEHKDVLNLRELISYYKRWDENGRTKGYLLPEGIYHYYVKQYEESLPKAAWISRYVSPCIEITDGRSTQEMNIGEDELQPEELEEGLRNLFESTLKLIRSNRVRRKRIVASISILCLIALIALGFALHVNKQLAKVEHSTELASLAAEASVTDPTLALKLAREAMVSYPTPLAKKMFANALMLGPKYRDYEVNDGPINHLDISPDQNYVLAYTRRNTLHLFEKNGKKLMQLKAHQVVTEYPGPQAKFSMLEKAIFTVASDSLVKKWNYRGDLLAKVKLKKQMHWFKQQVKEGIEYLYVPLLKSNICIKLDAELNVVDEIIIKNITEIRHFELAPINGVERMVVNDYYGVHILSLEGEVINSFNSIEFLYGVVVNHEKSIVMAQNHYHCILLDMELKVIDTLKQDVAKIHTIAISKSGNTAVMVSYSGTGILWNLNNNSHHVLNFHTKSLWNARFFNSENNILLTASDGYATIWNKRGELISVLSGHEDELVGGEVLLDSNVPITIAWDGKMKRWDFLSEDGSITKHGVKLAGGGILNNGNVYSLSDFGTYTEWSRNGEELKNIDFNTFYNYGTVVLNGRSALIVDYGGSVSVYNIETDSSVKIVIDGSPLAAYRLASKRKAIVYTLNKKLFLIDEKCDTALLMSNVATFGIGTVKDQIVANNAEGDIFLYDFSQQPYKKTQIMDNIVAAVVDLKEDHLAYITSDSLLKFGVLSDNDDFLVNNSFQLAFGCDKILYHTSIQIIMSDHNGKLYILDKSNGEVLKRTHHMRRISDLLIWQGRYITFDISGKVVFWDEKFNIVQEMSFVNGKIYNPEIEERTNSLFFVGHDGKLVLVPLDSLKI